MDAPFQMSAVGPPPPLLNPPPQIFGGYTPDGLPLQQLPPELAAQMFGDHGLMDDTNEAKRRRIARVRCPWVQAWTTRGWQHPR
jgi:hypothetical protein